MCHKLQQQKDKIKKQQIEKKTHQIVNM